MYVSAIGDAAKKGQMPKADKAVKIAKALEVPCDWLFNDERDWPPPDRMAAALLSEMELAEELARRRDLIYRDVRTWNKRLTKERLDDLHKIVRIPESRRTDDERARLESGLRDLIQALSYHNRLTWLEPDAARPPVDYPPSPFEMVGFDEPLREAFIAAMHRFPHVADARIARQTGFKRRPDRIAVHSPDGSLPLGVKGRKTPPSRGRAADSRAKVKRKGKKDSKS